MVEPIRHTEPPFDRSSKDFVLRQEAAAMNITWFGHSCFRIETGSSVILIDPFLTGNSTFEKTGLSVAQASQGVTHVALTHGHDDHTADETVVPCHYGTFPGLDQTADKFVAEMGFNIVRVPEPGMQFGA
jgi:L-ascorbate metabolism protein UlaG (beta-lactamase superfamily)